LQGCWYEAAQVPGATGTGYRDVQAAGKGAKRRENASIKTNSPSTTSDEQVAGLSETALGTHMLNLIRRARRRLLANELLSQTVNSFSAALLAFILLLLTGTELLRWQWLLLIPSAAAAVGVFFALRRLPSHYTIAQIVDRRLGLADTLSTAWFFQAPDRASASSAPMLAGQQEQAERAAQAVDIKQAIPMRMPRSVYAFAVLALVASSLFALRYGITRRLDLSLPLARILQQQFHFEEKTVLAKNTRRDPPVSSQPDDPADPMASQDPNQSGDPEPAAEPESENAGERTADKKGQGNRADSQKDSQNTERQTEPNEQEAQADQQETPSDAKNGSRQPSAQGQQSNRRGDQARESSSQNDANGSGESSSLLNKMKDAFENLLSRMKPQQGNGNQQQAMDQNGSKQQGKGQQSGKPQSAKDGQKGDSGQKGDAEEAEASERADNSADPQSKASGKSDGQQASKQPGSGIGSQDGDKSIKQAEQLAAMGKISEIIGKRSANLTGEATVQVQTTNQQLKTPYAQRGAEHAQGGAEIDRDEIPVALEAYVEKYFEQVRKQTPPKK